MERLQFLGDRKTMTKPITAQYAVSSARVTAEDIRVVKSKVRGKYLVELTIPTDLSFPSLIPVVMITTSETLECFSLCLEGFLFGTYRSMCFKLYHCY